jgi:2-oxoisovalerate ferredoxin oxidoreductase alpha subunit
MAPGKDNGQRLMLTGNYAAAYGAKLARAEAVPVYPITPQTTVMEKIIELIRDGELDAEYLPMESEHSVMAAAIAAEATGVRVFTASSSQGIAYMHENLFVASGLRLPIVMALANRCIGPPISIYPDHMDSLDQRDTGWIQYYVEDAQEIVDTVVQSYKVAEHTEVLLPVLVCYEGLIISHFLEPVELPTQSLVDRFLPPYGPEHVLLRPEKVMHLSVTVNDQYFMEYRYQQQEAMEKAKAVIKAVDDEFGQTFGRAYGGVLQSYRTDDAEVAILSMGSLCGLARMAVDELRKEGIAAGSLKLRVFRPFPKEEIEEETRNLKLLIVLDRDASVGMGGILYAEIAGSLYHLASKPLMVNYIMGLGGRVVTLKDLRALTAEALEEAAEGKIEKPVRWFGVRGLEWVKEKQ